MTKTITSTQTLKFIKDACSRFGISKTIVTDNGTQFTSQSFQDFCELNGIQHFRSAPYNPQSNGQAEILVDIFKRGIMKINEGEEIEETLNTFLTTYRYTPNKYIDGKSPAEIMIGRKVRTMLDLLKSTKQPETPRHNIKQEEQFNKQHGARDRKFNCGDLVYAKQYVGNSWKWIPGTIIEQIGNVMYNILLDSNRRQPLVRCHTNQLLDRYAEGECRADSNARLPLDLLMEEFQVDQEDDNQSENFVTPRTSAASSDDEPEQERILEDRPRRTIKLPTFLHDYVLY
ncbi:PREDICTED: uncharacterized protein K02A2.6-like [Cyphomyrmex costatus]|uniref:uncharacterized protein K02A2.6-like n=1 Tax=Cyphomyrmex costatus TaxID=456900 RepID=UPI0008523EB9|nr:PREDICTED: uncharacterized protein K02A2.6-like [Cyphomyrmex costatus]